MKRSGPLGREEYTSHSKREKSGGGAREREREREEEEEDKRRSGFRNVKGKCKVQSLHEKVAGKK